jgi:DNA-binding SARP family transcriptional activator
MQFGLLGPLEVIDRNRNIELSAARHRTILAALLLDCNRVVAIDRLVETVWDASPPRTAVDQIYICVSALRRHIRTPSDEAVIETRHPGYLLRIDRDSLDVKRFEELTAEGGNRASEGRLEEALDHYQAALALWRGSALEGVESTVLRAAATRLDEARLAARQETFDLQLRLGRHRKVTGELVQALAEHPLHERFSVQLMLALHRSGRRGEALAVFRTTRRNLREQLGLEPGAELRAVEQAVLVDDQSLDLPAFGVCAPVRPIARSA